MNRKLSNSSTNAARPAAIDRNLRLYSTAAIAAGVSVLALVPPAEAHVVVTRKTIHIQPNHLLSLDLNHDGAIDFQFYLRSNPFACEGGDSLYIKLPAGNAVVGGPLFNQSSIWASALKRGAVIGPSAHFGGKGSRGSIENSIWNYCSGSSHTQESGHWGGNPQNRYLGVKFLISGATHYGWIRLNANFPAKLGAVATATITAYAYETVANKAISAGASSGSAVETGADGSVPNARPSLGMLAMGVEALPLWRRREVPQN
jgi:hypothetical protein